jgi:hypothetical protein
MSKKSEIFLFRQTLSRILILKNKENFVETELHPIRLSNESKLFSDSRFDLSGSQLQSTSTSFHPWLKMDDCNENGNCSKVYGFTFDVVDK